MVKIKLFLLILILIGINHNKIYSNDDISNFLELDIELSQDTISFGDELTINVIFKNTSNNFVDFYPEACLFLSPVVPNHIYISYPSVDYHTYYLNEFVNITNLHRIDVKMIYQSSYTIQIKEPFFREGDNSILFYYVCGKFKGKYRKYNRLYGQMTKKIEIVVK